MSLQQALPGATGRLPQTHGQVMTPVIKVVPSGLKPRIADFIGATRQRVEKGGRGGLPKRQGAIHRPRRQPHVVRGKGQRRDGRRPHGACGSVGKATTGNLPETKIRPLA